MARSLALIKVAYCDKLGLILPFKVNIHVLFNNRDLQGIVLAMYCQAVCMMAMFVFTALPGTMLMSECVSIFCRPGLIWPRGASWHKVPLNIASISVLSHSGIAGTPDMMHLRFLQYLFLRMPMIGVWYILSYTFAFLAMKPILLS